MVFERYNPPAFQLGGSLECRCRDTFLVIKGFRGVNLSMFKWKVAALFSLKEVQVDSGAMYIYGNLLCFLEWVV